MCCGKAVTTPVGHGGEDGGAEFKFSGRRMPRVSLLEATGGKDQEQRPTAGKNIL